MNFTVDNGRFIVLEVVTGDGDSNRHRDKNEEKIVIFKIKICVKIRFLS